MSNLKPVTSLPSKGAPRALHSSNQHLLVAPSRKDIWLALTRARAFFALVLTWWNELPLKIRSLWDILQFFRACKMELNYQAFGWGVRCLLAFWPPLLMALDLATIPRSQLLLSQRSIRAPLSRHYVFLFSHLWSCWLCMFSSFNQFNYWVVLASDVFHCFNLCVVPALSPSTIRAGYKWN